MKDMSAMVRRFLVAGLIVFLWVGCTLGADAGTTGAIQGSVSDPSAHPLAGVNITAFSPSGHYTTSSSASGFYSFNGLPLDTFTLTFSRSGFLSQTVNGITIIQDQPYRLNVQMQAEIRSLGRVSVRGSSALVQPTVTADTYVVNQQRLADINGTPQDLNGFQAFNSLPGVTTDNFGFPTIRAGAENDVGYELDGIDNIEPITGQYLNALSLNGARSVQLSTGGYDVSNGNTNSGVINEVLKRGTYPGQGQATTRINDPIFGHEISFDYGGASPNNRFSYYFSFGGARDGNGYGDRITTLPLEVGQTVFTSLNDEVFNFFYHFGQGDKNELQFMTNASAETVVFNNLANPAIAPYGSNNGNVQGASDPFGLGQPATFQSNYITLIPGQTAYQQNTNQADTQTFNSVIQKLNFKRQLTASSFADVRVFKTYLNWVNWYAWDLGSFTDYFFNAQTTALGGAFDYTNQLSGKHELSLGGDGTNFGIQYWAGYPSLEPTYQPLEALGCSAAAVALGTAAAGGCYIAPFNAAINSARGLGLPTDAAHAPLNTYVNDYSYATDPMHRWDLYVKDRWQPNDRLTVTLGLRWDKESIALPPNAASLNTTYYTDPSTPVGCGAAPAPACNIVTIPGQPIGSDVTQPQQISPRIAASYQLGARDTLRFSFGKNIEFVPLRAIESSYQVPAELQNCNIANGCFTPLPGFGATNQVSNLYQQVILDQTTNNHAQYTPVLPQTAVNYDFSFEHDLGNGLDLRLTPYYRKGSNYVVGNQPFLFNLPSGTPVFGPARQQNAGLNVNTGVEFALQRSAAFGFSGLLDATYDNTLANYDSDYFPTVNAAALAARHFYHVTYVAPVTGTLNLVYRTRNGLHASTTISYESGYRYGVGKKTFVFAASGLPEQVLNTDLASTRSQAYYFTDPTNPGTIEQPNITGSRGTAEGDEPGTLYGPPIAIVNLSLAHELGRSRNGTEAGIRIQNVFANYTPTSIAANAYYQPQALGGFGPGSGVNGNACAPGQTLGCEPFMYNQTPHPYESEPTGPPRIFTFYLSTKY